MSDSAKTAAGVAPTRQAVPPSALECLVVRVRAEFLEMPGMHLTFPQAQRLWGLDAETCRRIITILVSTNVLRYEHGVIRRDVS